MEKLIANLIEEKRRKLESVCKIFDEEKKDFEENKERLKKLLSLKENLEKRRIELTEEKSAAETDFKSTFEREGFQRTRAVQDVLNKKNDLIAMLEEVEAALNKVDLEILEERMKGGPEAGKMLDRFKGMQHAYVVFKSIEGIEGISEQFKNNLLLAINYFGDGEGIKFIWHALIAAAKNEGVKSQIPYEGFSVAPFRSEDFNWTPASRIQALSALDRGANAGTIKTPGKLPNLGGV